MTQGHNTPSLYEMLTGHFTGDSATEIEWQAKRAG